MDWADVLSLSVIDEEVWAFEVAGGEVVSVDCGVAEGEVQLGQVLTQDEVDPHGVRQAGRNLLPPAYNKRESTIALKGQCHEMGIFWRSIIIIQNHRRLPVSIFFRVKIAALGASRDTIH